MKTLLFILSLLVFITSNGQNKKALDTLFANNTKSVSLFFPKPIRQGIVGKSHFIFSYNREEEQYLGLLQASPGVESNLLTITNDGQIYSYILKYSKKLTKLNYFIKKEESIGNEIPIEKEERAIKNVSNIDKRKKEKEMGLYDKNCASILKNRRRPLNISKQKYKIEVSIKNIVYHNDALYYLMEINNNSKIDYDVNYLRFFTKNESGLKRKSIQKLQIKPVYRYQNPKRIKSNSKTEFVIVLPKFSIDNQKSIIVELNELKGERNLELKLPNGSI